MQSKRNTRRYILFQVFEKAKVIQNKIYEDMTETERQVALYLRELGLWWVFESPVFVYDDKERPRVWTPDFYLPTLGMYVEVWSSELKSHAYREDIYKEEWVSRYFCPLFQSKEVERLPR